MTEAGRVADKASDATGPKGWYLAAEVGALVGVSAETIGQWSRRGYIRASQSSEAPHVYSFQDVAEAFVVHDLLDRGVRPAQIRRAISRLREHYGDWPLSLAPLKTTDFAARNGGELLLLEDAALGLLMDIGRGGGNQTWAFTDQYVRDVVGILRRGGWAVRRHPEITHIEVDPDRLSGRPTIRARRVPVELVAELAGRRDGERVLRSDYGLSRQEVADAVRWKDAVAELTQAA